MLLLITRLWAQELAYEEYQLSNGLNVILHVDRSLPLVTVDIWYKVGSKEEAKGRSGFAHMFEHLMFMGTTRLPGNGFDVTMEAHGGWNNAWTMEDATNYYDVGPPNLLPMFLWMEADRMQQLGEAMTKEKVDLQREVVRNERRQSYEDSPYGVLWLEVPSMLYPADHPYAHTVIGTHEDLESATLEDVKAFFSTWYVPNNASLVVAGDFDPVAVRPLIEQYFGGIKAGTLPERPVVAPATQVVKASIELTDQVSDPQVSWFWHAPPRFAKDEAELELLASLLGGGESSRLQRALVLSGLAQSADVYLMPTQLGSQFAIQVTVMEGVAVSEVEEVVARELQLAATTLASSGEMERLKNQFEYEYFVGLEPLQARASLLNEYRAYVGTPGYLAQDIARFRAVTPEGIQAAAARYLQPGLAARILVTPESGSAR